MTAVLDTPAALLAELTSLGIELQALGDRLRFRPQSAMTAELVARVKVHKPGLLALLAGTKTKTPAGAAATPGFGFGVGDVLTATSYTADEARMLADAPADLRAAVETIKREFPGAKLVRVEPTAPEPPQVDAAAWPTADDAGTLPAEVADLARKRDGWTPATWRGRLRYLADACAALHPDRAAELRRAAIVLTPGLAEAFEERAAIMEYDAGLSREDAEAAAAADTLTLLKGTK